MAIKHICNICGKEFPDGTGETLRLSKINYPESNLAEIKICEACKDRLKKWKEGKIFSD